MNDPMDSGSTDAGKGTPDGKGTPAATSPPAATSARAENSAPAGSSPPPARRGFIAGAGTLAAGVLALLAPLWSALRVALDPVGRTSGEAGMVLVTRLAAIPDDGVPRRFRVVADRTDAWNAHRETPVGAVYLRREGIINTS